MYLRLMYKYIPWSIILGGIYLNPVFSFLWSVYPFHIS